MLPLHMRFVPKTAAIAASLLNAAVHAKCDEWLPAQFGPNGRVHALIEFNGMLIAGGIFSEAGLDDQARNIAMFDGQNWVGLAGGMSGGGPNADSVGVRALAVYNGELIAGGFFTRAGGNEAHKIARFNGRGWAPLDYGVDDSAPDGDPAVFALLPFNGELIAAGRFAFAGDVEADHIASWNGRRWSPVGAGLPGPAFALAIYKDQLVAGGQDFIMRWNGESWTPFGGEPQLYGAVRALLVHNDQMFIGGRFIGPSGATTHAVIQTDGSNWAQVGNEIFDDAAAESTAEVRALAIYNGDLIAAGMFTAPGASIARFDGRAWHPMSNLGANDANALLMYSGALTAAGEFVDPSSGEIAYVGGYSDCEFENPADANGDGFVNIHDLLAILTAWGACPDTAAPCTADIAPLAVGDDQVNIADLMLVISLWD